MTTKIRQRQPAASKLNKTKPADKSEFEQLFIRLAFEQDIYATNDLISLRALPRMRDVLNIRGTKKMPSVASLDYTKAVQLEIVAAHVVGSIAEKACSRCSNGEGFFQDCVVVLNQQGLTFLEGVCTNCAFGNRSGCSMVEL